MDCQKDTSYIIKIKLKTYCLAYKKHTSNISSKRITMKNKVVGTNQGVVNVCLINQDL